MANYIIRTITVDEAARRLQAAGMKISGQRLRAGIVQGVYPWGEHVKMKMDEFLVYEKLFEKWMAERGEVTAEA